MHEREASSALRPFRCNILAAESRMLLSLVLYSDAHDFNLLERLGKCCIQVAHPTTASTLKKNSSATLFWQNGTVGCTDGRRAWTPKSATNTRVAGTNSEPLNMHSLCSFVASLGFRGCVGAGGLCPGVLCLCGYQSATGGNSCD